MGAAKEKIESPAMTEQQRRYSAGGGGALRTYKELQVGVSRGWGFLSLFEAYNLFVASLPSALGFALRQLLLPRFCRRCGKGAVVGRSVTIRSPQQISIGTKAFVDDYVILDARHSPAHDGESSIDIGEHAFIGRHSILLAKPGTVRLGKACNVSSHCRIATQSSIEIGDSVLIAAYVYIGPGNHRFDNPDQPIMEQGMSEGQGVRIGDNVWIGTRATILDGVTIGSGAVIGAHALVTEDVPDNAIVAGTPAKVIRYRE